MECRCVEINTQKFVNCLQTCSVSSNGVVGWGKAIGVLVPWWRAWKYRLNEHGRDIHIAKCASPNWEGTRWSPKEHACTDDHRRYVVEDAVWQPSQNIKNNMLVCRQDVAEICTVQNVFQGRQDAYPDCRSIVSGNISKENQVSQCCNVEGLRVSK